MFSYFTWKKSFCSRKWWGEWGLVPPCPPFSAILLTDVYNAKIKNIEEKKYLILLTQLLMLLLMLKQIWLKVKYVICCSTIAVENKIPNVSNLIKKNRL